MFFLSRGETMQITAELDNQHIDKLKDLEKIFNKNTSELISFALDEIYCKQKPVNLVYLPYLKLPKFDEI